MNPYLVRLSIACGLLLLGGSVRAQDVVYQKNPGGGAAKWTGSIADFTGEKLTLTLNSGRDRVIPFAQVERIETTYDPEHRTGRDLLDRGQYNEALEHLNKALRSEQRVWVRRQILALQVRAYAALGQTLYAVQTFKALVESDPHTQYFDAIPLLWHSREQSPATEAQAARWLTSEESALDVLLGASLLLSTAQRNECLRQLTKLSAHSDPRIAWLAQGQIWRGSATTAPADTLDRWEASLEKIPPTLRAGPAYVLGRERARRKEYDRAALLLLRVPIQYPEQRLLSAQALLAAGSALQSGGQAVEAAGLYREVLQRFAEFPDLKNEADQRLRALAQQQ